MNTLYRFITLVWASLLSCSNVSAASDEAKTLAFVGARLYASPGEDVVPNATVVVTNGKIIAVGRRDDVRVPPGSVIVDCSDMTLTSGFWNSHVHFIGEEWKDSATREAATLTAQLQTMLTRYGVTHAFETATFDLDVTLALRRRIAAGEVKGPAIYTTGVPFVVPNGTPVHLAPLQLPEMSSPAEVGKFVRGQLSRGADGVKFFAVVPNTRTSLAEMPVEYAKSAVEAAHERGKLAFAHPTNVRGVRLAIESGVDVIVHVSADQLETWDEALVSSMRSANVALIPTLKLYEWEAARQGITPEQTKQAMGAAQQQLRLFSQAGGPVLFGTDVGYMTDYDPAREYELMRDAGLSFAQVLASLTTTPAGRFGAAARTGRVAAGMDADLVLMAGDPATDIRAFTSVRYVYRRGERIYPTP